MCVFYNFRKARDPSVHGNPLQRFPGCQLCFLAASSLSLKARLPQLCPKPCQLHSAPTATLLSGVVLGGLCVWKPYTFSFVEFLVSSRVWFTWGAWFVSSLLHLMSVSLPSQDALHIRRRSSPFPVLLSPLCPCPFLCTLSEYASAVLPWPLPALLRHCLFWRR